MQLITRRPTSSLRMPHTRKLAPVCATLNESQEDLRLMKEVERILRVDHAGEYGAINIYKTLLHHLE